MLGEGETERGGNERGRIEEQSRLVKIEGKQWIAMQGEEIERRGEPRREGEEGRRKGEGGEGRKEERE